MALILGGCSWITDFVVVNRSGGDLSIGYRIEHAADQCPLEPGYWHDPYLFPTDSIENRWRFRSEPKELVYDEVDCSVSMTIPPKSGIVLWTLSNFQGFPSRDWFPTRIALSSPTETASYNSSQIPHLFRRQDVSLYLLDYSGTLDFPPPSWFQRLKKRLP